MAQQATDSTSRRREVFWKISLICCGLLALSSGLVKNSAFWSGYVLDIAGPSWIYMLIRGQYSSKKLGILNRTISPEAALILVLVLCFIIEMMQYLGVYESTFDPFDFLAYFSGTFIFYLLDRMLQSKGID